MLNQNEIKEIIANFLEVDIEEITNELKIKEDLELEDIYLCELILLLEEKFDIHINKTKFLELKTIEDVLDYLLDKIE